MSNPSFTRDEVILTLDVIYFSGEKYLSKSSRSIIELCELLQDLPIHPLDNRALNFRNTSGVRTQIYNHCSNMTNGTNHNIGRLFKIVDDEFSDKREELHDIAEAIKRNLHYIKQIRFANAAEEDGFIEGALLAHLHRHLEQRDKPDIAMNTRCSLCHNVVDELYHPCTTLMQQHLLIPPTELNAHDHYDSSDFIAVCPNCHAALHRYRPWLTKDKCGDLFRR